MTIPTCPRCGSALAPNGWCEATTDWCRSHPLPGCEQEPVRAHPTPDWQRLDAATVMVR